MGSTHSDLDAEQALTLMYTAAKIQNMLPDVGIDDSLLKYSGINSNSELQTYSNNLINTVPGFVNNLGSSLASLNSVPNAVGLGALVLSMILEFCVKSSSQSNDDSYSMLQRVFGEEKASTVRNTMLEYLKRHQIFIKNQQRLQKELQRLEEQLSGHLTTLKTSLQDGQMSTRGFKIWVNGASFHVQMLVHEARLKNPTGQDLLQYVNSISVAIDLYVKDLDNLLQKYKDFMTSTEYGLPMFTDYIFSHHEAITGLRSHFLTVKNNLNSVIKQHSSFSLRSRA
ncbi:hypothetical protein Q8A73_006190 [Channa argus]|nr:hypothetical protein Q8A73_006190 [Channa argus]